jgi:hypothetical protein
MRPLRFSAFSASKSFLNAKDAENRKERRENFQIEPTEYSLFG